MSKAPITILIAEDHGIVREGLRILLDLTSGFKVVGEAANGCEAVELATEFQPDVILMDIAMPTLNGFEATRQIRVVSPDSKVLVLSAHSDEEYVEHFLSIGVAGYVVKQNSGHILVQAIREVASGGTFFGSSISKRMKHLEQTAFERGKPDSKRRPLTPREAQVLQLVAEGSANKQIAADLGISIKTVEKHRQQLMDKLNIHETAGLTRYAIATGVIESCIQDTIGESDEQSSNELNV
jgi:DNA-binding NarL/FixJ family response regulator